MKAIERFVEARSTVEGKAVAVALTALLALSSFTPATLAVADEGEGSSDEMSLAVNDVAMPEGEDGFSAPNTPRSPMVSSRMAKMPRKIRRMIRMTSAER